MAEHDAYLELLGGTRRLRSEQREARDEWLRELSLQGKEELLFELEVLLKGAACFSNPRNHSGPVRRAPIVAQDFHDATRWLRDGLERSVELARRLLGERDRRFAFQRYLESVLPEDALRSRIVREGIAQSTPVESLMSLRHGLTTTLEVVEGVLRAERVPYRLFYSLASVAQREVAHSAYFNPLAALEFRPEFDRIGTPQIVELIRVFPVHAARRLVALAFLSMFRMLRYIRLLGTIARDTGQSSRARGRGYLVLAVLRSDARALTDHLRGSAGQLLAAGFEEEVLAVPAAELPQRAAELRHAGLRVRELRAALEGVAGNLRLELARVMAHELPAPDVAVDRDAFRNGLAQATESLRPTVRNALLFLAKSLGSTLPADGVFDDRDAARESAERLRRDVWMFGHIVQAFAAKAHASTRPTRDAAAHSIQFVREFLAYFRTMGYPLLRATDYPRVDAFLRAMESLGAPELVDPVRLEAAVQEAQAFHGFLGGLFDEISRREVLRGVPFDRRAAAKTLQLYLGTT